MREYIERKDAILALTAVECKDVVAKEAIALLPAADVVEVRHGRWEKTSMDGFLRCSVCHDCYIDDNWLDGKHWNFCPHCGADLRGEDDG